MIFLLLRLRGLISNKWALLSHNHIYRRYFLRTAHPWGDWDMVEAVNLTLNLILWETENLQQESESQVAH